MQPTETGSSHWPWVGVDDWFDRAAPELAETITSGQRLNITTRF